MKIDTTITTGNYSINLTGTVDAKDIAALVKEGLNSKAFRKVSPKLDVPMANHIGQTHVADGGVVKVNEGFKKKNVEWDADLAAKMVPIYEKEFPGFTATVTKYEPTVNASVAEKVLAAKLAGLELAKEFMTEEQYNAKVAELKGE